VGKSAVADAIDAVVFAVDVQCKQPRKGVLTREGKRLRVTINLGDLLESTKWTDWKARLADVVGVLLPIVKVETEPALADTAAQLSSALGKPTAVQIKWDAFIATSEWAAQDAGAKLAQAVTLATSLVPQALLGPKGLAGIAEFNKAKSVVNEHIKVRALACRLLLHRHVCA
jgi:hypothetical protein